MDAVQRSFSILKKTWGEAIAANFGIGFITFLAMLILGLLPMIGAGVAFSGEHYTVAGILVATGLAGIIVASLISSALNTILLAALYLYAAEGKVPSQFDNALLERAFVRK